MKKKKFGVIAAIMCTLLCGCNSASSSNLPSTESSSQTQSVEATDMSTSDNSQKKLTEEELAAYAGTVEITTKNWQDYIDIDAESSDNRVEGQDYYVSKMMQLRSDYVAASACSNVYLKMTITSDDTTEYKALDTNEVLYTTLAKGTSDLNVNLSDNGNEKAYYTVEFSEKGNYSFGATTEETTADDETSEETASEETTECWRVEKRTLLNTDITEAGGTLSYYQIPADQWHTDADGNQYIILTESDGTEYVRYQNDFSNGYDQVGGKIVKSYW